MSSEFKIVSISFALAGLCFYLVLLNGLPFTSDEMDLNKNGVVGFSELSYFFDYGTNPIIKDSQECLEYYALKDGVPLKVECKIK